jgi:hypothetical protein
MSNPSFDPDVLARLQDQPFAQYCMRTPAEQLCLGAALKAHALLRLMSSGKWQRVHPTESLHLSMVYIIDPDFTPPAVVELPPLPPGCEAVAIHVTQRGLWALDNEHKSLGGWNLYSAISHIRFVYILAEDANGAQVVCMTWPDPKHIEPRQIRTTHDDLQGWEYEACWDHVWPTPRWIVLRKEGAECVR